MDQRKETVEIQWKTIELQLSQEKHVSKIRLIPLFLAAQKHPFLKQFFPYTSHERLGFSFKTTYPWSEGYPFTEPIPPISEFGTLGFVKSGMDFEISVRVLQAFVDKYQFLLEIEQPFINFDEHKKIVEISDISRAVEWLFEQTFEMYTIYENTTVHPDKTSMLTVVNTEKAVELLVERLADKKRAHDIEFEPDKSNQVSSGQSLEYILKSHAQQAKHWIDFKQETDQKSSEQERGELKYVQFDELETKDQIIIHRLVELGVTVRNVDPADPTIAIDVPHGLSSWLNIEVGFLLNALASGDFVENLRGIASRAILVDLNDIKTENAQQELRSGESYITHMRYYVSKSLVK